MAAYLKTVTMKVDLRLDDRTNRVIAALDANNGVLLPTINQLMAEAWAEGYDAESFARDENPYVMKDSK